MYAQFLRFNIFTFLFNCVILLAEREIPGSVKGGLRIGSPENRSIRPAGKRYRRYGKRPDA
jgi:hypothetical protein